MKRKTTLCLVVVVALATAWWALEARSPASDAVEVAVVPAEGPPTDEPQKGPDRERWFFDDWHGEDHGPVLDRDVLDSIWSEIRALPESQDRVAGPWSLLGASGMFTASGGRYSGRVLDIDHKVDGSNIIQIHFAAASGGLWHYNDGTTQSTPITDDLPTQAVGTVSVNPGNHDDIIIGTGEHWIRGGLGVFRSTDGGQSWASVTVPFNPGIMHRIRHIDSNRVITAGQDGWHKSTDGGATWFQANSVGGGANAAGFDLSLDPNNSNIVYSTWFDGATGYVIKSTNAGDFYGTLSHTVPGAYRGAVAVAPSNSNVVYAAFCNTSYSLEGIYKSTDAGGTWSTVYTTPNYMGGQGWYNNVISVHPTNENIVYAGGVGWKLTTDGGSTWADLSASEPHMHVDFHAMDWIQFNFEPSNRTEGLLRGIPETEGVLTIQLVGQDGGWVFDNGGGYSSFLNVAPITQYTHVHASVGSLLVYGGGSQDNGMSITTDNGASWYFRQGGDGSDLSIDPANYDRMWSIIGVYGGPLAFRRHYSTDRGLTWEDRNSGINPAGTWYTDIVNDVVPSVWLYTNAGTQVYQSTDSALNWNVLGTFSTTVRAVNAATWPGPIYVTLASSTTGDRVWVNEGGWVQRDAGLPTGVQIRSVVQHPTSTTECYALVNGIGTPGQKVYRSFDRGVTWTNITGNLPDVPMGGIVGHPANINWIVVGTEMGCFRTTDGGTTWHVWNDGMPDAAIVADMTWVNRLATDGDFYVVAGTYGRSMYARDIISNDPTGVADLLASLPKLELAQNAPNPAQGNTRIDFTIPKESPVSLKVYDVAGREVQTLVQGSLEAGPHSYDLDVGRMAAGVYFYKLVVGHETRTKKMVVLQ